MCGEFLPVGLVYISRTYFLFKLAMQLGFFVVLLEKNCVSVRIVILSKGMRVSSKENFSGRGYVSIIGPLYPGPQRAAR